MDAMRVSKLADSVVKALESDTEYQAALCWPKFILSRSTREHINSCLTAAYEMGLRAQAAHDGAKPAAPDVPDDDAKSEVG